MSMDCLRSKLITLISVQRESFTIVILHNNNCFRCLLLIFFHFPSISFRPEMLRGLFDKYGELGDVYIPRDYQTRQPRGFAFVRFANRSDGEEAQRALDGTTLDGRVLAILEAQKGRAENPKQAMTERGPPPRDHDRRWGNERDHRPRVQRSKECEKCRMYYDYEEKVDILPSCSCMLLLVMLLLFPLIVVILMILIRFFHHIRRLMPANVVQNVVIAIAVPL